MSKSGSIGIGDLVDAGSHAKNVILSYGNKKSPSTYRPANGLIMDTSGELLDLRDINIGNSYGLFQIFSGHD